MVPTYKLSVTLIEKFRRVMLGLTSFDTEESLFKSIKGEFVGTDKTLFGNTYHSIIEFPNKNKIKGGYQVGDVRVSDKLAINAIEYANEHPSMVKEVPVTKLYEGLQYQFKVSGRTDGIEGVHVRDAKTKFSEPSYMEYYKSCQWKFYLDMLELDVFYYDLFVIKNFSEFINSAEGLKRIPTNVEVETMEPMKCDRYEALPFDCNLLVNQFEDYLINKNLIKYLKIA